MLISRNFLLSLYSFSLNLCVCVIAFTKWYLYLFFIHMYFWCIMMLNGVTPTCRPLLSVIIDPCGCQDDLMEGLGKQSVCLLKSTKSTFDSNRWRRCAHKDLIAKKEKMIKWSPWRSAYNLRSGFSIKNSVITRQWMMMCRCEMCDFSWVCASPAYHHPIADY